MGEVLETWLRDRLGLIIDLSPESFGLATRDGTLLAQLLHSYDIIDNAQLKTINTTEDPALARVNLKHLRIWLKFIGVDCPDDTIEDISNGRGTTAARLFYKIFVSLESKDKLHFITQQKEREKFIPNSSKFDVTTVSDDPPIPEPLQNPLADQLLKNASVISWHRDKFEALLDRCKTARKRDVIMEKQRKNVQAEVEARIDYGKPRIQPDSVQSPIEKEMQNLKDFDKKHEVHCAKEYSYHELCREKKFVEKIDPVPVDPEAAKTYVKCMKDRTRRAMETFSCKAKMGRELTTKLWEEQKQDQEKEFDAAIANKLFSQSQYEKQMMNKLCEIRDQKRRIARNRGLVDKLMQERIRTEYNAELAREHEVIVKGGEDIQAECIRLCELHRRIREEKIRNSEEKRYRMCEEVLDDLIDIAIRAARYRESDDNWIPSKIWAEWKALFVKSQPIFDPIEHIERSTEYESEEQVEEIRRAEIERQSILNDDAFENYLNLRPPWDEFVPEIGLETEEIIRLGMTVLGYIVHRLLNPFQLDPEPASVPKVSSACILLGVLDVDVYPIMETLLKHRGVKLIRVEDAINHCLSCYKNEMKNTEYIDVDELRSMKEAQRKIAQSTASRTKKESEKKSETPVKTPKNPTPPKKHVIDEETQTPHALPDEDMSPDLSNPAYIGKRTHEFLTLGQPIPNELNTKIIIEYLKSLTDVKGWVLIDYPNTFDQMARLEMALTGHRVPLEYQSSNDPDGNIDEVDPELFGIPSEGEDEEESSIFRESRLVCNPIPKPVEKNFNSYMTAYIRALPKPKNMLVDETDVYEILPEDTTPVDAFYTDQGLAYAVYYTSLNTFTLKRICRIVIGDLSIPRVPSEELFGDGLYELRTKEQSEPSKAPIIKQLVPRPETANVDSSAGSEYEGEGPDALNDILGSLDADPVPPKPGEDGWEWIKFPQAQILLEALATLWENMETVYVEDLKEIFFVKRVHYSMIVPYRNYVTKHMAEYIQRPDVKQDMLYAFHTSYNDIEKDLRDDLDVRCELHCRVADFRKELWEVCDERRNQAEVERQRIISQDWTAEAMVVLANLYISILKAELDRCIDTIQLLQDYYISMLQRPIAEDRLLKYPLQRLELNPKPLEKSASILSPTKVNKPSNKGNKNMTSKGPQVPPTIDCSRIKKQITDLFIVSEREPLRLEQLICYEAVLANITYVQNIVESLASTVLDGLKREEASFTPDAKGRVQITKAKLLPTANDEVTNDLMKRGSQLCQEWRAAVQFEINRTRLRLKLLDNAALSDISFLYETMEHCFHNMLRSINDRYDREIKSVDDMASVFCSAIEGGIPIQEELLLDGDRFIVRSNVLMYPDPSPPSAKSELIREAILPLQFRMGQLGRLMDIFRYVAPHGSLPERCFTHILEDMVTRGDVEGGMALLPSSWSGLRPSDVEKLVLEIFGDSEYVDWREFIIYAMDIAMPSQQEILDARSQFLAMDPNLTETVTRDEFHKVNLWFSNCSESRYPSCKTLLHGDWQADEEEEEEEELLDDQQRDDGAEIFQAQQTQFKREEASRLVLPKTPPNPQPSVSSEKSFTNSTFSSNSRNMTPQETVRLVLAKELLCDMFASGCDKVNYTAFLMAFSKSYDPREGLGKALTLGLGERVCVSEEEGENFVRQLLEQQQMQKDQREAAEQTASTVIDDVLETTLQLTEGVTISEIDALHQCGKSTETIVTDPEQQISIQNLDTQSSKSSGASQPNSSLRSGNNESENYEAILTEVYSKHSLAVDEDLMGHWIPRNLCQSVLVASLPWHARQPDILGTTMCLRECLGKVYANIFDPAISEDEDSVLSHRLINHEFITNLINSTTAFTIKNIGNIVQNLLSRNSDSKQTLNC